MNGAPVYGTLIRFESATDSMKRFSAVTDSLGEFIVTLTKIETTKGEIPTFELHQNYPNPFSEQTTIRYTLPTETPVTIAIYDILGRRVKTFTQQQLPRGTYQLQWDGTDEAGRKVAYGVYFYQLQGVQGIHVRKMLYLSNGGVLSLLSPSTHARISETVSPLKLNHTESYIVYIENTDSTKPMIKPMKKENVIITSDTVLNFPMTEEYIGEWEFLGLAGERVTSLAFHPTDTNVIYAGTAFDFSYGVLGKLFKTTNGGQTWDTLIVGGNYRALAVDQTNPNVIYALPHGVLKSADGGRTWRDISQGIRLDWETFAYSIAIDPAQSNVIYVGTVGFFGGSLYKSTNGGESWADLARNYGDLTDGVTSIAIDFIKPSFVYAGTTQRGRLYKTTDGGTTWEITGLGETSKEIADILALPGGMLVTGMRPWGEVWKSGNEGTTWFLFNQGLPDSIGNNRLAVTDEGNEIFLFGNHRSDGWIFRRWLHGTKWLKIDFTHPPTGVYAYTALEVSPGGRWLYFGSTSGLYRLRLRQ